METNMVTMSLEEYDKMKQELFTLREENSNLVDTIEALKDNDAQKVIIKETCICEDEDGDECECTNWAFKGFDEVKQEVEEFYKKKFEDLDKENEENTKQMKEIADKCKELRKETQEKFLEKDMEIANLKHRNLWQRILNK